MSALDAAALERASRSHRSGSSTSARAVTAEVLGRIIACAWRVGSEDDVAAVLTPTTLSARILDYLDEVPDEMEGVLHIDHRVDGDEIEEASRLIVGAQSAGVLGRLNPTHTSALVKADVLQANALLDQFEAEFPATVAWARKVASTR